MALPRISSKDALKSYILRQLGGDANNIELTDDNLEDSISDTLDDYLPRAYSGVIERYIPVQLLDGIQDYQLPYPVFAVIGVHDSTGTMMGTSMPANLFSMNQFIAADLYRPGAAKIDVMGYELINQMVSTLDLIFAKKLTFDYNSITKKLHLFATPAVDTKVIIHTYQKLDMESTPVTSTTYDVSGNPIYSVRYQEENIYNERWIKRMAVAKAQLQWGKNLQKYTGSILPNGGTLNGEFIYTEAKDMIEKCMTELHEEFELPTDFFVG